MKYLLLGTILFLSAGSTFGQYSYEPTAEYPFGRINPDAPGEVADFAPLIGASKCLSVSRATNGTWNPEVNMRWIFKYIMNGMAVQDETLKEDGAHSGSIRQFHADSSAWYVHYYASSSVFTRLPSWEGAKKEDGNIVLYREQQAPNGTDGYYRLTFYEISEESFKWVGEWVDKNESFEHPTWKISCQKENSPAD